MGALIRILGIVLIHGISWLWEKVGKGVAWAGVAYFTFKGIGITTAFVAWIAQNGLGGGSSDSLNPGPVPWDQLELIVCALNGWVPVGEWWFLFTSIASLRLSGLAVKLTARAFKG
jgi:hypothetical protein